MNIKEVYIPSGRKKYIVVNEWMDEWKATKVPVHVLVPFQAWEDLLKFDTTAGNIYHWSIYSASAKVES